MKSLTLIAVLALVTCNVFAATATITWTAPTQNTDGSAVKDTLSYSLMQGLQGAALTSVQTGIAGTKATVLNLVSGQSYCFAVVAVDATSKTQSAQSTPACVTIPAVPPDPPTALAVQIS